MERHLADNRTYHVNKKLDSRMDDSIMKATPVSSIETGDSTADSAGAPLLSNPYPVPYPHLYHQSPYLSYNPFPYHPSPHYGVPSPYIHPYYQMAMSPYVPQTPGGGLAPPQTPKTKNSKAGFGPDDRTKTEAELPYCPPTAMAPITVHDRAITLPELDFDRGQRRATFGGVVMAPVFRYNESGVPGSDAPGPSRRKHRHTRRSELGALPSRRLFDSKSTTSENGAKIADDDGIVNRLLGPVENTD